MIAKESPHNALCNGLLPVMTQDEFMSEGHKRFGNIMMNWKFVCPSCGHIASVQEYKDAGAPQEVVAFSCIGHYTGAAGEIMTKNKGPCNYAGGGLFKLNPQPVKFPNGNVVNFFQFAPAEQQGVAK